MHDIKQRFENTLIDSVQEIYKIDLWHLTAGRLSMRVNYQLEEHTRNQLEEDHAGY
jgi:hypothetical protein